MKFIIREETKGMEKAEENTAMEKINDLWQRSLQFFREVRIELKKVTWPSRKETIASTSVVLITVILVSFYLGIVDLGLSRLIKIFLG